MANSETDPLAAGAQPNERALDPEQTVARAQVMAAIFAASPDNIMVLDAELRIRFINWTVPDLTPAGVIGTPVYEFVPDEFRAGMRACFERVKSSARPDRYVSAYVSEDGSVSTWESRVGPILSNGVITGYVSISSNVTERSQEAAARDLLFHMSLDMLCVADLNGMFKSVNPAAERTLGFTVRELLEKPYLDFAAGAGVTRSRLTRTRGGVTFHEEARPVSASTFTGNMCGSTRSAFRGASERPQADSMIVSAPSATQPPAPRAL